MPLLVEAMVDVVVGRECEFVPNGKDVGEECFEGLSTKAHNL